MQRFDIREAQEVAARGRYLRWDTDSGQPIGVRAAGVDYGQVYPGELLELPEVADKWLITPAAGETGFVRVGLARIDSDRKNPQSRVPVLKLQSGSNQVAAGQGPGWVSGSPASMPPSSAGEVVFDLGPEWAQYTLAQVLVSVSGPSSGLAAVQIFGSDTAVGDGTRRLPPAFIGGWATTYQSIPSSGMQGTFVRPVGRYLTVAINNADASNATGAGSRVTVAVYPA